MKAASYSSIALGFSLPFTPIDEESSEDRDANSLLGMQEETAEANVETVGQSDPLIRTQAVEHENCPRRGPGV